MITKNDIRDSHYQLCSALRDAIRLLEFSAPTIPKNYREATNFETRLTAIKKALSKGEAI